MCKCRLDRQRMGRVSWSPDKMCVKDTSNSLWWCPAWLMLPAHRLCRLRSPFHIRHLIFTGALCNNEHKMVMAEMCSLVKGFVKPACGLVSLSHHHSFYGYIFSAESKGNNRLLFICHFFVRNCCSGKISGATNNINCVPVGLKLKQLNRLQQFILRFFLHPCISYWNISEFLQWKRPVACFVWSTVQNRTIHNDIKLRRGASFENLELEMLIDSIVFTFWLAIPLKKWVVLFAIWLSRLWHSVKKKTSPGCAAVVRTFQVASFQEICSRQITLGMCPVCGGNHIFLRFQFNFRWFTEQADMNEHPSWQWDDFVVISQLILMVNITYPN